MPAPLAALASHPWAYPAIEVVHLFGVALLLGNLVAFEARVWGAAPTIELRALARLSLLIAVAGFSLAALTGMLMFATQPEALLVNNAFRLKMALLFVAGLNAAAFHARGSLARLDSWARAQTAVSILIWIAVLTCGRWIAYA